MKNRRRRQPGYYELYKRCAHRQQREGLILPKRALAYVSFITYRVVRYYKLPRNYKGVIACVTETLNTHRGRVRKSLPPRGTRTKHRTLRTFLLVPPPPSLPPPPPYRRSTSSLSLPSARNDSYDFTRGTESRSRVSSRTSHARGLRVIDGRGVFRRSPFDTAALNEGD